MRICYLLFCGMLVGCGGSSSPSTPPVIEIPPPPTLEVQPLNLSFSERSFPVSGSRKVFVVDETVFATDSNNRLLRLNSSNEWEKNLEQNITELVKVNGTLITDSGHHSFDNGDTWDVSTTNVLSNLTFNSNKMELYASSSSSLIMSQDNGSSWITLASFEETIFDFLALSSSEFLVVLSGNEDSIAIHNTDSDTTQFITPESKLFSLFIDEGGRIIGTGASDVLLSGDNGRTWTKLVDTQGELFSQLALGIEIANGEIFTVGSQDMKKIGDNNILEDISFEQSIGVINSIGATSDKVHLATPSGLFSADLNALKQENKIQNIQALGLPTGNIDSLISSPQEDFYFLDSSDNASLYSLDSDLRIFTGNKRITSLYKQTSEMLFMTYSSNTEQGFGGVGYYNLLSNEFSAQLEGFDVQNAVEFANSTFVHYAETATSKQPNSVLQSSDNVTWDSVSLPDNIESVLSINKAGACGEFNILARDSQNIIVLNRTEDNPTAPWESILETDSAVNMKSSEEIGVVWSESSFWFRDVCSGNYEEIELQGNISGNISDLIVENSTIWFATDLGELWKFENSTLFNQALDEVAITQLFISKDRDLYVITRENVSSTMVP